ncbi:MAG: sulfatase [Acidobacteriota bacterium]
MRHGSHRVAARCGSLLAVLSLAACRGAAAPGPGTVRLVDRRAAALVSGTPGGAGGRPGEAPGGGPPPAGAEWRFERPPPGPGTGHRDRAGAGKIGAARDWEPGPGVAGLAVHDGKLIGRSSTDFPLIHLERGAGLDDQDLLHEIRVRLRVSAGANLSLALDDSETVDLVRKVAGARTFPWRLATPIVPGGELRTYVLRSRWPHRGADIRHILIRPTDAPGATFEIESVRLVFRRQYLASIPSGAGWQGLGGIYRETIVSRAPESIRFEIDLPDRPWLDLAIGTIEGAPVTFRVTVSPAGPGAAPGPEGTGGGAIVLERTVTTPRRWEPAPIDLASFAGRRVGLTLSLAADAPGRIGFWGSPVVRRRRAPPGGRGRGAPPRGVILIMADTLRRDHLDAYGYARATGPALRGMAEEGALFADCLTQATWTKVAAPSLVTSLYPAAHGVREFDHRLPGSAVTAAEIYRDAGHATVAYSSNLFTGRFSNMHQGFEELHEDGSLADPASSKTSREYMDRALAWIEAHRDVPFFVFLHLYDPHDPYRPGPPYDAIWADPSRREEHERQARRVRELIADPQLRRFGMPSREELAKAGIDPAAYVGRERDLYDGSIRGMDAEVGRLLERLRGLRLADATLVAFVSDHGEEFLEHGEMFHGHTVYGELTDVPLILWGPGVVPRGAVVGETVELVDVLPTLLELSGLRPPPGAQGRSLVPLLGAARAPPPGWESRPALVEKASIEDVAGPGHREEESYAAVTRAWKLIHNVKRPVGRPEFELYDRRADPLERNDVAARHPAVVERLSRELAARRDRAAAGRLPPGPETAEEIDRERLERLRGLGYIR